MTSSIFDPIRQEPANHCTSTLEAVSRALRIVGSSETVNTAAHSLELSLKAMVKNQLRFALDDVSARPRYKRSDGDGEYQQQIRGSRSHRKLTGKRRNAQLSLSRKPRTPEEIEAERIRFVYVAHLG